MSFGVLTHNTKRQSTKKNKEYSGLYKIKDIYSMKDLIQKIKRQVTNWEKNICKHTSNEGFVSKHTKNANTNNPMKNRERSDWTPGQRRYTDSTQNYAQD